MEIVKTKDGSHTLRSKHCGGELYHSHNGSIQEAQHIFIDNGIKNIAQKEINIFEMGFGSGLNAIMTYFFAQKQQVKVNYYSIEAYPIGISDALQLNYNDFLQEKDYKIVFEQLHQCQWNKSNAISSFFTLHKINAKVESCDLSFLQEKIDIVYYDAFAPNAQAHLWEEEVMLKMKNLLKQNAFLISYCAKGSFKRSLKKIGFEVMALPGPIGKREITKAVNFIS